MQTRPAPGEPSGVLVVRVWRQPGSGILCSRLLSAPDLRLPAQSHATCAGVEDTVNGVRGWLETWLASALPPAAAARDGPWLTDHPPPGTPVSHDTTSSPPAP